MHNEFELERLFDRLFNDPNKKLVNFNVWWGDKAHELTVDQRAKVLNDMLDQEAQGNACNLNFEDATPKIDIKEFVKNL